MIRVTLFCCALVLFHTPLLAQQGRGENLDGNDLYERGLYEEALDRYQEALKKNPDSPIIRFNSGNARYKTEAYDEALAAFGETSTAEDQRLRARSFYNLGNTQYRKGSLQDAVESYKQALRLDPDDIDAKFNLEYVLKQLEENPPQENQQGDQERNQEDQEEEQQDQEENQEEQQQNQDKEESENNEQNQQQPENSEDKDSDEQQDQQQQESEGEDEEEREQQNQNDEEEQQSEPQEKQDSQANPSQASPMTREQVEQILQALQEDQKDLLRKRTVKRKPPAGGKDW